ncbi:hypothetical protein DFH07DRAFT_709187, partial [Mycena maculata]
AQLAAIPVVGSFGFLSSYRDAYNAPELIQQGFDLYTEGIFRVARLFRWDFIVCGPELVKEEDVLFSHQAVDEVRDQARLPWANFDNTYHKHAIRTSPTRNLHRCFPHVRDKIVCPFDDVIQFQGSGQ